MLGTAVAAAVLGVTAPALAETPAGLAKKEPLLGFSCGGGSIEIFGARGRSGWVDGTHYLLRSFEFSGTFTPIDGGEPQTDVSSQTYGLGPSGETITCTASFTEETPEGTFVGNATATVVAVR
jgi:hypothetical protein